MIEWLDDLVGFGWIWLVGWFGSGSGFLQLFREYRIILQRLAPKLPLGMENQVSVISLWAGSWGAWHIPYSMHLQQDIFICTPLL
jgi:hypothetical protein